jgi:hypothetical protein
MPNAFYSGSIDYTSVDTWGLCEEYDGGVKGRVRQRDLTGKQTFHAAPSRPLNLPQIDARNLVAQTSTTAFAG